VFTGDAPHLQGSAGIRRMRPAAHRHDGTAKPRQAREPFGEGGIAPAGRIDQMHLAFAAQQLLGQVENVPADAGGRGFDHLQDARCARRAGRAGLAAPGRPDFRGALVPGTGLPRQRKGPRRHPVQNSRHARIPWQSLRRSVQPQS
jgi:hypothetical protein